MIALAVLGLFLQQIEDRGSGGPHHRVLELEIVEDGVALAGHGPVRWTDHPVDFGGRLLIWARSDADLFLRVEDDGGVLLAEDEDSAGGTTPYLQLDVEPGEGLRIAVATREALEPVTVQLHLVAAVETAATLAAAREARARWKEAKGLAARADAAGARRVLREALEGLRATGGEWSYQMAGFAWDLGVAAGARGDLPTACAFLQESLRVHERYLFEDHLRCLMLRRMLADKWFHRGDLETARRMQEAVLAAHERILSGDHEERLKARAALAVTLAQGGDLAAARALLESALAGYKRTRPEDHDDLLRVRSNLANVMFLEGDIPGAVSLNRDVLAVYERTLPDNHPSVLITRSNLAALSRVLGDFAGARALLESVLAEFERTLPDDHPRVLGARMNLASAMYKLKEFEDARRLVQQVLEVRGSSLPEGHINLLRARMNAAVMMTEGGDLAGARELQEDVLPIYEETLPENHPDLLWARASLARTMMEQKRYIDALPIQETLCTILEREVPADDPDLLRERANLAVTRAMLGDFEGARELVAPLTNGLLERFVRASSMLSRREARSNVAAEADRISVLRFLASLPEGNRLEPGRIELIETMRDVASLGLGTDENDSQITGLRKSIGSCRARIGELASASSSSGPNGESDPAAFSRLRSECDQLERELKATLAARGAFVEAIRVEHIARGLPQNAVAVGYYRTGGWKLAEGSKAVSEGQVLVAHAVGPEGALIEVELDTVNELERLAGDWRAALGRALPDARGRPLEAAHDARESLPGKLTTGHALRSKLLDPILAELDESTTMLILCPADLMHTLPLEALPLDEGVVGDRFSIVYDVSMRRLVAPQAPLAERDEVDMLAVGAVSFAAAARSSPAIAAASPPIERSVAAGFADLPGTREEVERIADLFSSVFDSDPAVLVDESATKAAFHQHAPGKRFLHVATHGWFAPIDLPQAEGDSLWAPLDTNQAIVDFAPMSLCGLAFAGARNGRDELGRVPGILTAEELIGIDLSVCDLAVLSACETNVGIRSAGVGIESLKSALHSAGVRSAVTSLWEVDDARATELMERFYTYLWVNGLPKYEALWKAKCDLRAAGYPERDWAVWVLSGDPN